MRIKVLHDRCHALLTHAVTAVKLSIADGKTDITTISEAFVCALLAEVYGWEHLQNLNIIEQRNYPTIDLGDEVARVAIQVTATKERDKIVETLDAFVSRKLYEKYDRLIFYILTERQQSYKKFTLDCDGCLTFSEASDIIDSRNLIRDINALPIDRLECVVKILEAYVGNGNDISHGADVIRALMRERSSTFQVPGLGLALPISKAWIHVGTVQVDTVDIQSQERTKSIQSSRSDQSQQRIDSEAIASRHRLSVVVADPGCGKSTLLKRVAHTSASKGENVIWFRLPNVSKRMLVEGIPFSEAVVRTIADMAGIDRVNVRALIQSPHLVLADGLDECGARRNSIAAELSTWAGQHPDCRMLVTTRPIGYDAGTLPGWRHFEVLPLSRDEADRFIGAVLDDLPEQLRGGESRHDVIHQWRESRAGLSASGNPLLLGCLLGLHLRHRKIGSRRTEILGQVVALLQETPPNDRDVTIEVESTLANRCLDVIAWVTHSLPDASRREIIAAAGNLIQEELGLPHLRAEQQIEQSINYWSEHQILDRASLLDNDAVQFVHASLTEFCIGRYIATMDHEQLAAFIGAESCVPRWREPILFAGGSGAAETIISNLLSLRDTADPRSNEEILAADIVLEAASLPDTIITDVVSGLAVRLQSDIPRLAVVVASKLSEIADRYPDTVARLTQSTIEHEYHWTRLSGVAIVMYANDSYLSNDDLVPYIDDLLRLETLPWTGHTRLWTIQARILMRLWVRFEDSVIRAKIENYISGGAATIGLIEMLQEEGLRLVGEGSLDPSKLAYSLLFRRAGFTNPMMEVMEQLAATQAEQKSANADFKADRAFLQAVLLSCSDVEQIENGMHVGVEELIQISILVQAFNLWGIPFVDFQDLENYSDDPRLTAVFHGVSVAAGIDRWQLLQEAEYVLLKLETWLDTSADLSYFARVVPLLHLARNVDVDLIWGKSSSISLDLNSLARALDHPLEFIAKAASHLIVANSDKDTLSELAEKVYLEGGVHALHFGSSIAGQVWKDRSEDILLQSIERGLRSGVEFPLRVLPTVVGGKLTQRAAACYEHALMSDIPDVVKGAVDGLLSFSDVSKLREVIAQVFDQWTLNEARKPSDQFDSPRPGLMRVLVKAGNRDLEWLYDSIRSDTDYIQNVAAELAVDIVADDLLQLEQTLDGLVSGTVPYKVGEQMLKLPAETMEKVRVKWLSLSRSPDPTVRILFLKACGLPWIDRDTAIALCKELLKDASPDVRSRAWDTIRTM